MDNLDFLWIDEAKIFMGLGQDGDWVDYGIFMGYMMISVFFFLMAVNG